MKQLKIGLIGFGTVCEGFYNNLKMQRETIKAKLDTDVSVEAIYVRRPLNLPEEVRGLAVDTIEGILEAKDIDVVIEAINGATPADDYIIRALESGKHVVTANKAALAKEWQRIEEASVKTGATVWFEASVCGGIPVIETLKTLALADEILSVEGILNGTTNYILSLMATEGVSYEHALKKAQALGYAEADPSADVDGIDAANKLAILCAVCFGKPIDPKAIEKNSISGLESVDAATKVVSKVDVREASFQPKVALVTLEPEHALYNVVGVTNRLRVVTKNTGELIFTGPGAGGGPTGTALLMDLVQLIKKIK